jgi:hypothetical protein
MKRRVRHVFPAKPEFCCALKPDLIMVRCPECGFAHEEYFGPEDRDEREAELQLLRQELSAASAIIRERSNPPGPVPRRRKSRTASRRPSPS